MIAFWLLFTRRVHTVFASTGLTNVYRQKLTGNLFGRIVDGNYYFIDGHARTTDLLYSLIIYWPAFRFANALNAIIERAPSNVMQFCALKPTAISSTRLISCHVLWRVRYAHGIRNSDCINDKCDQISSYADLSIFLRERSMFFFYKELDKK